VVRAVRKEPALLEIQEEAAVGRVVQLLAHRREPRERLDQVSVDKRLGVRVDGVDAPHLLNQHFLAVHRLGVRPPAAGASGARIDRN